MSSCASLLAACAAAVELRALELDGGTSSELAALLADAVPPEFREMSPSAGLDEAAARVPGSGAGLDALVLALQPPGVQVALTAADARRAALSGGYQPLGDASSGLPPPSSAGFGWEALEGAQSATEALAMLAAATEPAAPAVVTGEVDRIAGAAKRPARDASAAQLRLDVARDEFVVCGTGLSGAEVGAEAVLAAVAAAVVAAARAALGPAAVRGAPGAAEAASALAAIAAAAAASALRSACRTDSGAVAFAIVRRLLDDVIRERSLHLAPDSAAALPAVIDVDVGPYRDCEGAAWRVGARCRIEAAVVFRVVDVGAASEAGAGAPGGRGADGRGWDFSGGGRGSGGAGAGGGDLGRVVAVFRSRLGLRLPLRWGQPAGAEADGEDGGWESCGRGCEVRVVFVDAGVPVTPSLWRDG